MFYGAVQVGGFGHQHVNFVCEFWGDVCSERRWWTEFTKDCWRGLHYLIALCGLHAYTPCKELLGYRGNKGNRRS